MNRGWFHAEAPTEADEGQRRSGCLIATVLRQLRCCCCGGDWNSKLGFPCINRPLIPYWPEQIDWIERSELGEIIRCKGNACANSRFFDVACETSENFKNIRPFLFPSYVVYGRCSKPRGKQKQQNGTNFISKQICLNLFFLLMMRINHDHDGSSSVELLIW